MSRLYAGVRSRFFTPFGITELGFLPDEWSDRAMGELCGKTGIRLFVSPFVDGPTPAQAEVIFRALPWPSWSGGVVQERILGYNTGGIHVDLTRDA